MINIENINQGLMMFYLIVAILLLALAILVYPTLSQRSRSKKSTK